jgi:hypothetical protein
MKWVVLAIVGGLVWFYIQNGASGTQKATANYLKTMGVDGKADLSNRHIPYNDEKGQSEIPTDR